MTIAKHSDEQLRESLRYELSPYPLALFDEERNKINKGTSGAEICRSYVSYVKSNYKSSAIVVSTATLTRIVIAPNA